MFKNIELIVKLLKWIFILLYIQTSLRIWEYIVYYINY